MPNTKVYTAQKMREKVKSIELIPMMGMELTSNEKLELSAMLRYAADVVERCEAEIAKLPYPPNADDVYMFKRLNYILRGDARKERTMASKNEKAGPQPITDCNRLGNAAKMREALSDACYAMFNFLKTQNGGYEEMAKALDKAKSALADPPRNCDRPECATTKAAQEVWRKEDGGKTAYYEWLLATSTK